MIETPDNPFGIQNIVFGLPNEQALTPNRYFGSADLRTVGNFSNMANAVSASEVANILAADIHRGALKTGETFQSERELCDRFDTGRNTIREALTILQGMGLVDQSKGKRPRVANPTLARIMVGASEAAQFFFADIEGKAHLEQARLFLETSMLRYAIENASNAQIAKMVGAVEECQVSTHDVAAFREADVKFHRALAEVPGNPIFVALHETFVERLMRNRPVSDSFEENNEISNKGHREIITALLAKDADRAVAALTAHLTRNYESNFHRALEGQMARIS